MQINFVLVSFRVKWNILHSQAPTATETGSKLFNHAKFNANYVLVEFHKIAQNFTKLHRIFRIVALMLPVLLQPLYRYVAKLAGRWLGNERCVYAMCKNV